MMDDMRHSPLPWSIRERDNDDQLQNEILDADGLVLTHDAPYYPDALGIYDMRFVVEAVNAYPEIDRLRAEVKALQEKIDDDLSDRAFEASMS